MQVHLQVQELRCENPNFGVLSQNLRVSHVLNPSPQAVHVYMPMWTHMGYSADLGPFRFRFFRNPHASDGVGYNRLVYGCCHQITLLSCNCQLRILVTSEVETCGCVAVIGSVRVYVVCKARLLVKHRRLEKEHCIFSFEICTRK